MTNADARNLAWEVGGDVMVVIGLLVVLMVGLAVIGEIRR